MDTHQHMGQALLYALRRSQIRTSLACLRRGILPCNQSYVEQQIREKHFDIVLSHTCPFKYEPTELFLGGIDQRTVDDSTERWLDTIEESIQYKAWFCGHWHTDKRIDKMHFLSRSFESDEQFKR